MKERKREVGGKENQIPYQRGTHTLKRGNSKKGRAKAKGNALQWVSRVSISGVRDKWEWHAKRWKPHERKAEGVNEGTD